MKQFSPNQPIRHSADESRIIRWWVLWESAPRPSTHSLAHFCPGHGALQGQMFTLGLLYWTARQWNLRILQNPLRATTDKRANFQLLNVKVESQTQDWARQGMAKVLGMAKPWEIKVLGKAKPWKNKVRGKAKPWETKVLSQAKPWEIKVLKFLVIFRYSIIFTNSYIFSFILRFLIILRFLVILRLLVVLNYSQTLSCSPMNSRCIQMYIICILYVYHMRKICY